MKSKDYDADKIEVERQIDIVPEPMSESDQTISNELEESFNQLMDMKINVLSHGHSYPAPNSNEVIVHFSIPDTEKRIEEIKDIINESLIEKHIQSYSIKINQINLNQSEKESNWSDIFRVIIEGLTAKKEYKVTGFAYSFHPAPLQIIIKTSINESDEDAYEQVLKIENYNS